MVAGPRERSASSSLLQVFLHWFMTILIENQDVRCATRLMEALSKQIKEFQKVVGRLEKKLASGG